MRKSTSLLTSVWLAVAALIAGSFVALAPADSARAVGNASIYWVYNQGNGFQLAQAIEASTLTPSPIAQDQAGGATERALASDGTSLYFVDNAGSELVKTDLFGSNRIVLASVSGVQQLAVEGGNVYYVEWNNGLFSVPIAGGSPTQIFSPSDLPGSCSGQPGGWAGIAVTASDLFFSWNNGTSTVPYTSCVGVYRSARSAQVLSAPQLLTSPSGSLWTGNTRLQIDGSDLYVIGSATNSVQKTADYSTWSTVSVAPASGSYIIYSLAFFGSTMYMTSTKGNVYSMPKAGGTAAAQLFNANTSGGQIVVMAQPANTVTYQNGGGTGSDLVQTIQSGGSLTLPSPTACPASATDPCFAGPVGSRARDWELVSGTFTTQANFLEIGRTITPTSNVVIKARWMGGPLTFSLTSGTGASASVRLPNTVVGATTTQTIYVKNSSSAVSQSLGNIAVSNTNGLIANGGTCSSSTTLTAGSECTIILNWTPSASGDLPNGTQISIQVAGGNYFDVVQIEGTAVTTKMVTFNANTGAGSMAPQVSSTSSALTANAFSKPGYTFRYWTPFSDGSGTQYLDRAIYAFSTNITLYAQWVAIPSDPEPQVRTINFVSDDNTVIASSSFTVGSTIQLPAAPSKEGFTFKGWFTEPTGGIEITSSYRPSANSNIAIYAQWLKNEVPKPELVTKSVRTSVLFDGDSAKLSLKAKAKLKNALGKVTTGLNNVTVRVAGFVKETASKANDRALSLARAKSVVAFFKSLKFDAVYVWSIGGIAPINSPAARKAEVKINWAE